MTITRRIALPRGEMCGATWCVRARLDATDHLLRLVSIHSRATDVTTVTVISTGSKIAPRQACQRLRIHDLEQKCASEAGFRVAAVREIGKNNPALGLPIVSGGLPGAKTVLGLRVQHTWVTVSRQRVATMR